MNILMITRSFDQIIGGMEIHCQLLVDGLVKKGHRVTVLTSGPEKEKWVFTKNKPLSIEYLGGDPRFYSSLFLSRVKKFIKENQDDYDVIHQQSMCVRFKPKKPLVTTMHGTSMGEMRSALSSPSLYTLPRLAYHTRFYYMVRKNLQASNAVIAVSDEVYCNLFTEYDLKKEKTHLIYNGVDTDKFKPKIGFESHPEGKQILYVGRVVPEKGLPTLADAVKRIGGATLVIIGDVDTKFRASLDNGWLKSDSQIIFGGRVEHDQLPPVYQQSDIFILPTLRNEGMPISLLEAMSCGLPCIISDMRGLPEIVGPAGFVFPAGDAHSLEQTINQLLFDREHMKRMGEIARKRALEFFSLDAHIKKTIGVYKSVLG